MSLIIDEARKYLGSPFHHQGRVKEGIDCAGLVVNCGQAAGHDIEDTGVYGRGPEPERLLAHIEKHFFQIEQADAGDGDMILFWVVDFDLPQHVGLLTAEGTIIHTWANIGKVVENSLDKRWTDRIHSYWRYK